MTGFVRAVIYPLLVVGLAASVQAFPTATEPEGTVGLKAKEPEGRARTHVRLRGAESRIHAMIRREIARAIRAHGQPFDGPGSIPPALLQSIEGKRLIGLGESTHGTSELVTMRGNLILACAKKEQVTVLMEDQYGCFAAINQWIHGSGGEGELHGLMSTVFSINNTLEFGDFLTAARAFNAKALPGQGIDIYGIDMQVAGWPANNPIPMLRTWCATQGHSLDAALTTASGLVEASANEESLTGLQRSQARGAISQILSTISGANPQTAGWPEAMIAASNLDRFAEVEQACNANPFSKVFLNALHESVGDAIAIGIRDAGMAANIKLLLDTKVKGKAFFWGHNAHVGRLSPLDMFPTGLPSAWTNVGSYLSMWLGDGYAPIAFETGAGSFRAKLLDAAGKLLPNQTIVAPDLPADAINVIARSVFNKPVFIKIADLPFMGIKRIEMAAGAFHAALDPYASEGHTIPGQAYFAVVSFPVSTATRPMK